MDSGVVCHGCAGRIEEREEGRKVRRSEERRGVRNLVFKSVGLRKGIIACWLGDGRWN